MEEMRRSGCGRRAGSARAVVGPELLQLLPQAAGVALQPRHPKASRAQGRRALSGASDARSAGHEDRVTGCALASQAPMSRMIKASQGTAGEQEYG